MYNDFIILQDVFLREKISIYVCFFKWSLKGLAKLPLRSPANKQNAKKGIYSRFRSGMQTKQHTVLMTQCSLG